MTSTEPATTTHDSSWNKFLEQLTDYVRLELADEAADEAYPQIAFYIEHSSECESAYYQEFRRQSLQKPFAELRQLGSREQVVGVMQQILNIADPVDNDMPNPNWYEVAIEQGRAWVDHNTERWRQLRFTLAGLELGQQPIPAFSGFLGTETSAPNKLQAELHIAPEGADLDIHLSVTPESTTKGNQCQLEVVVTWQDGFGDYSGAEVSVIREGVVDKQTTDTLGKARFDNLPSDLTDTEVQVTIPE